MLPASAQPKNLSRTSGSTMDAALSCTALGSMNRGKETKSTAQPTTEVLTGLAPRPPKAILPRLMAMSGAMTAIHQGASAGSMKDSSRPEQTAV